MRSGLLAEIHVEGVEQQLVLAGLVVVELSREVARDAQDLGHGAGEDLPGLLGQPVQLAEEGLVLALEALDLLEGPPRAAAGGLEAPPGALPAPRVLVA